MQKCVTTKFTLISCVTVSSYMTLESGPYQTNKILPRRRSGVIFNSYKGSDVVFGAYGSWSYNIEDVGKENYCPRVAMNTAFATLIICWVEITT